MEIPRRLVRGEGFSRHDDFTAAINDAIEAVRFSDVRFAPHVYFAAIVTLGTYMITRPSQEAAITVLRLCKDATRLLRARRVPARSLRRGKIEAVRAAALAALGSGERAEGIFQKYIRWYCEMGLEEEARHMASDFVRILETNFGQRGRAADIAEKYKLPNAQRLKAAAMVDVNVIDRDDSPIGF